MPLKKAWVQVPLLLPGERTSTRVDPAKSIYATVPTVEALDTESAPPAEVTGTVTAVVPDDPRGGILAVVAHGAISVIITERRRPFHFQPLMDPPVLEPELIP